jgi:hypothetical protein
MQSMYNVLAGLEENSTADANKIINVTAATFTVTQALHSGKLITMNLATGIAIALPNATGSGMTLTFLNCTPLSGSGHVFTRGRTADAMVGVAQMAKSGATNTATFLNSSNSNVITLNGTTTGGLGGDFIHMYDVAVNQWFVEMTLYGSGTLATPFSNS